MLKALFTLLQKRQIFLFSQNRNKSGESLSKMSVFIQKLNPLSGETDWVVEEENYDYHQEVARSSFADMLHDRERNQMYESALKSAINIMHLKGKKAIVLDIGTGTGLLSMMAVRHGADQVVACEAFKPMSECAKKIVVENGFANKIQIIAKRSTDLTVGGDNGDLKEKCNILVTEVFDTELIGEGALKTFNHANQVLLETDCIVVPHSANIYAQIVECPLAQSWNKFKDIYDNEGKLLVKVPDTIRHCPGAVAVHDLQLNQLKPHYFKTIASPISIFHFDWSGKKSLEYDRCNIIEIKAEKSGTAQVVFMWWDLQMDTEGKIILSCAPYWAHPLSSTLSKEQLPWRDHWMQAIYYLPQEIHVQQGDVLNLFASHDEFSLWFNLKRDLCDKTIDVQPTCNCGLHAIFSRTRIGQMNDSIRNKKLLRLLEQNINNESIILVIGHSFYLSLAAASLGTKLYFLETNALSRGILSQFIKCNKINNVEIVENLTDLKDLKIDVVIGEPYFLTSILPWDNLMFVLTLKLLKHLLTDDVKIVPKSCIIKGIAVNFTNLHKIRLPLGDCEGFKMDVFDHLIENSSNISDETVEPQPLWEYPGIAVSEVVDIALIDCTKFDESRMNWSGTFELDQGVGGCNGIALWVEWFSDDNAHISTGPISQPQIGQNIEWYMNIKQGVCLFPNKNVKKIEYEFKLDFNDGNIHFKCFH